MHTAASCEQYAFIGTDDAYQSGQTHNLSALQLDLSTYKTFKLEASNNQLKVYSDNILLKTLSYSMAIGNVEGIKLVFKGTGSLDWVKLKNATTDALIYEENFDNCNTICPGCPNDWSLNQYYLPSGGFDAANTIESVSRISSNSNVEFNAVSEVTLNPFFETFLGALFEINIGPCSY